MDFNNYFTSQRAPVLKNEKHAFIGKKLSGMIMP
jgi:hypothetical protein